MNQGDPIDSTVPAVTVQEVIFAGTPSQVVNLPVFIKGFVAAIAVIAMYVYAIVRWPVPWDVPALALVVVGAGVVVPYLRTAIFPQSLWINSASIRDA